MPKLYAVATLLLLTGSAPLTAVDKNWNVPTGSWNSGENWDPTGLPGTGDAAFIRNNGTVTVESGGPPAVASSLRIGDTAGTGTLNLASGGSLTINNGSGTVTIGNAIGGMGTLNFGNPVSLDPQGAGQLNANEIVFGVGTGSLNFYHDSYLDLGLSINGPGHISHLRSGYTILRGGGSIGGEITVRAGTLALSDNGFSAGNLTVGMEDGDSAEFNFEGDNNGFPIDYTTSNVFIGREAGSTGSVDLSDGRINWTSGPFVYVGEGGAGTLKLQDGGRLHAPAGGLVAIGLGATAQGTVTVTGEFSEFHGGTLYVGDSGMGSLTVGYLAELEFEELLVGSEPTGSGEIALEEASISIDGTARIGGSGTGTFTAGEDSTVYLGALTLGHAASGHGTLVISDNTTFASNGTTYIGNAGIGILTLEQGATAQLNAPVLGVLAAGQGTMNIGADDLENPTTAGDPGNSVITTGLGSGRVQFNQTNNISFGASIGTTTAVFQRGAGTTTLTAAQTYSGTTTVSAGALRQESAGIFSPNSAYVITGGTLNLNSLATTLLSLSGTGGTVQLGSANLTLGEGGTHAYSGVVAGSGGIIMSGPGNFSLLGAQTFSGGVQVLAGRLSLGDASGLVPSGITGNLAGILASISGGAEFYVYAAAAAQATHGSAGTNGANGSAVFPFTPGGNGGPGGAGSTGVTLELGTLYNAGTVAGGNGGAGGSGGTGLPAGLGGNGGVAGDGVIAVGSGPNVILNTGTISAGTGGAGGSGFTTGTAGAGGIGIRGQNLQVTSSGSIQGGLSGSGVRNSAIHFTAGTNRLELQAGFSMVGNVLGGGTDTLVLGGEANFSFNSALLGSQYLGFEALEKRGNSHITLTGSNAFGGTVAILGGVLYLTDPGEDESVLGLSTVEVGPGGTLAGNGAINNDVVVGGKVAPGAAGAIGTLRTTDSLTWHGSADDSATMIFDLGPGGTCDTLQIQGGFMKGFDTTFRFDFQGTVGGAPAGTVYTLATFGSTIFSATDFSYTNLPPGFSGTFAIVGGTQLTFTLVGWTPLENWRYLHFGSIANAGDAANSSNPDLDASSNLIEFGIDGNPKDGNFDGKTRAAIVDLDGTDYFTLTLPVRTGATFTGEASGAGAQISLGPIAGVSYRVEGSLDLVDYNEDVTEVVPALSAGMPSLSEGWTYRTFRLDSGQAGYLRFLVE